MVKHMAAFVALVALATIILAMWFGVLIGRSACDAHPANKPIALRGAIA